MKKETGRKNKRWIWLCAGLCALLVIVGTVLMILPALDQADYQSGDQMKLYWNVDKSYYTENSETGLTTREPSDDGLYHIRFSVDGQQIELLAAADRQLINYIDTMSVMGLVFDANGMVVDAVPAKDIATEIGRDLYVKSVEGDTIYLNSSMTMNGMEQQIRIDDQAGIYEVFPEAEVVGQIGNLVPMDVVTVYADAQESITHIFVTERAKDADLYWRIGTYFNESKACTTREPDENGVYSLLFAYRGEQVELKCRDVEVVNTIDGRWYGACGLVLDAEGYIVEYMQPALAIRGVEIINNANITELNGDYFSATRFIAGDGQGQTVECTIDNSVGVYLVCEGGTAENYIGEPTTLQPDDRVTCYTDLEGNLKLVFVVKRMADSPMYFNLNRQYISSQKRTERSPNADGWYEYEMAVKGKVVTVRTKDYEIANKIDSISSQAMGLKLKGNVVEKVYDPTCICGWSSAAIGRYVTGMSGMILSAAHPTQFDNYVNLVLNTNCEIYDVSGAYGKVGAVTEPRVGDEVTAFRNVNGELTHVFITNRYVEGTKIYYNTERRYNSATKQTTRTPDADGYYIYTMVCEGKEITVKTKSKDMASYIDKQNAPLIAMKVSNGIVKEAYPAVSAVRYGQKTANFHYISSATDSTLNTYYYSNGKRTENPNTYTLASNCIIYNVSEGYVNYRGERTSLKADDRIQAIATNPKGQITQIFVMERKIESSLYWNVKRLYNAATGETTRVPDADGYYVFQLAVKGVIRTLKTKDKALASKLDSYSTAVGLLLNGDVIKQVYPTSTVKGIKTLSIGRYDVTAITGKTVTFTRNRPTSSNYGDVKEVKMASNCRVYDVSDYAEKFGAAVELQLGDRVAGYINEDGELIYAYIVNRNTHKAGHISHCDHCDKDVFWEPYAGEIVPADVHYYLTCDTSIASRLTIGKPDDENNYDVVFDLNGFDLNCIRQAFLVCDQLSLVDTAEGGSIQVQNQDGSIGGGIMVSGGVLNIYSGTVTAAENAGTGASGGLVYLASNAVCNMYGGTVIGGLVASEESIAIGGNVNITSTAEFTMYDGIISGGTAAGNGRGGNIYASGTVKVLGGEITGGIAGRGGNLYLAADAKLTLSGGSVLGGTANDRGGNICDEGAVSQITGGAIGGGTAKGNFGGNICVTGAADMTISGGTVENGESVGNGGNLAVTGVNASISMTGGRLSGGKAGGTLGGGNIYLAGVDTEKNAVFTMTGGEISDGIASSGGNLRLNANSVAYIGGMVTGGEAAEGSSISLGSATAKLIISGTITEGDVYINKDQTVTLTGSPVVDALVIVEGNRVMLDKLELAAAVSVTANGAFTVANEKAASWSDCFISTDEARPVTEKDGVLYCGLTEDKPDVPDIPDEPEYPLTNLESIRGAEVNAAANAMTFPTDKSDYVADCPACGEKQVTWKAITANGRVGYNTTGHFYCTEISQSPHTQFIALDNGGTVCLHLNGETLNNAGRIASLGGGSVINIMGSGTVSGNGTTTGDYKQGVLVVQNKGTINLYGGNFTSTLTDMPVAYIQHNESVLNLYPDAVIDSGVGHNVDVINGTVNMYGGTIKNAVTTGSGGNIRLRSANGVFNMYDGSIRAGSSSAMNAGGNVYITGGSHFNLYDGVITEGQGTGMYSHGKDVYVYNGLFTMYGGTVDGQVTVHTGYTVHLDGSPVIKGSGLWLEAGAKVTWGELKQGTAVTVCAEGAFTDAHENAVIYADWFNTPSQLSKIICRENVLYCESDMTADSQAPLSDGKSLKVLALTSSFGLNTTEFLYDIAVAQGATEVVIGRLYASGCSLQKHVDWANNGTAGYEYTKNSTGTWVKKTNATLLDGLLDEDWDIIYLQQSGANSPAISTYGDYIDQLTAIVNAKKTNPDARFVWNMTWAYQSDSTQPVFVEDFNSDQMAMYRAILNAVRKKVQVREDIAAIIPSGTAIQNARTSYFGDTLTVDTYHLNNLGRVIAGYTAYAILTDSELTQINLNKISSYDIPETLVLSDNDKAVILEAVNAAVCKPFEVTSSSYTSGPVQSQKHPETIRGAEVNAAANAMTFPTDKSDYVADCPACGAKQVTWKAISASGRVGYNTTGHFYCTEITQSPHTQFIALDNGGTVCLHLNGETLNNAGRIASLGGGSVINIMGSGTVSGNGTTTGDYKQGVLVVQNKGTINLYGGNFTSTLTDMPVAYVQHAESVLNMYPDAVISSGVGHNVDVINGKVNMYGGVIKNAVTTGSGGNVRLRSVNGVFNMYDGEISCGSSSAVNAGGNVYITGNANFYQYGGEIADGTASASGLGRDVFVYKGTYTLGGAASCGGTYIADNGKINILNDWTGCASVLWSQAVAAGQNVPEANGQCGSIIDGLFVPGGSFEGALTYDQNEPVQISAEEGVLKLLETVKS